MKHVAPIPTLFLALSLACNLGAPQSLTPTPRPQPTSLSPTSILQPTTVPPASIAPIITLPPPPQCAQFLCDYAALSLLELQGRPLENNILKLFSAAADPTRNRIYVSGIMTRHIAILDGAAEQWIGTVDSGIEGNALKYLYLDPATNYLYVHDTSNGELRRIDLNTGELAGPTKVPASLGNVAVDTKRTRVYLTVGEAPGFRAFDGQTMVQLYASDEMHGTGEVVYDENADAIYVLDGLSQEKDRAIHVVNPETGRVAAEVTYTVQQPGQRSRWLEWDSRSRRFFVGDGRIVLVLNETGQELSAFPLAERREVTDMAYDAAHDRLLFITLDPPGPGEVAGTGGHLEVYDPTAGKRVNDLSFGRKPHRLTLNAANGRVYVPNGDASVVWSIPTETFAAATPIRLGDSLEQIILTDGGIVHVNSRLGGSYVIDFNPRTGAFEAFTGGVWPYPIRASADGQTFFVLNAWDSTLAVYSASPRRSELATIPIGLPRGTTDRLPDLAIDSTHKLAYAAYPEFGQIAVVDWNAMKALTTINVSGFPTGDIGGSPGQLQVAVDESANRLFVFWAKERRLTIYDGNADYAPVGDLDLSSLDWSALRSGPDADLLYFDAARSRLFVGPFEFDANGAETGRTLGTGQRIFAVDETTNAYWASGADGSNLVVARLDRDSLAVRDSQAIGTAVMIQPAFAVDLVGHLRYVGYLQSAELRIFTVGG